MCSLERVPISRAKGVRNALLVEEMLFPNIQAVRVPRVLYGIQIKVCLIAVVRYLVGVRFVAAFSSKQGGNNGRKY